jgi:hypothetical protein
LCGAVAFELGNAMTDMTVWVPIISGAYAWMPAALLFCERLLRAPTRRDAVAFGIALALACLAGFPQIVLYTCQLIALRVLWGLASRRVARPVAAVGAIGSGLLLAPLLAAIQLFPTIEVMRASVRSGGLTLQEMAVAGFLSWEDYRLALDGRLASYQPLMLVPCILAVVSWLRPATRARALFYLLAGALCFVLAFGPNTPLFAWYTKLPLGDLFRDPKRLMWVTSFCLAVLTALGVDALRASVRTAPARGTLAAAMCAATLLGLHLLAPSGLRPLEWGLGALVVGAAAGSALAPPSRRRWAVVPIGGALLVNLVALPSRTFQYLLSDSAPLFSHASTFARLRARMSAQDRVDLHYDELFNTRFAFGPKSASLFEVPALTDYQPQIDRRYAEFFMMLRTDRAPARLHATNLYWHIGLLPRHSRRLLNLTAARYLLVDRVVDRTAALMTPPPTLVEDDGRLRLYENSEALPRAFYVPQAAVVSDPKALLERLAHGADDPRRVALLDADLPSGFRGVPGNLAAGSAEFMRDDPEHVAIHVRAPERGFLVLSDQFSAGWLATVDGAPSPIARANYAFRLVEVPGGDSTVAFRYAPASVRLGMWTSGLTCLLAGLILVRRRASA